MQIKLIHRLVLSFDPGHTSDMIILQNSSLTIDSPSLLTLIIMKAPIRNCHNNSYFVITLLNRLFEKRAYHNK